MTTQDFSKLTTSELQAIRRTREFTYQERAVLHGDTSAEYQSRGDSYNSELVRRLDAGEYLTKADAKRARAIKRGDFGRE